MVAELDAQVCPCLGLKDDPETSYSFPSHANHCFRSGSCTALRLDYQRKCCLSGDHTECELFRAAAGVFPKRFIGTAHRSWQLSSAFRKFLLGLFVILGVTGALVWLILSGPGGIPASSPGVNPQDPLTPIIENTFTPPQNTAVPSPSSTVRLPTSTLLVLHALDVPIGTLTPLVIHQVSEGESLEVLASHFNTTSEAIIAINYDFFLPLWPNALIVIPLGQVNVIDLPQFEPYHVKEAISLNDLAADLSVDIEMLKVYNLVGSDHVFAVGDWVLIPH